MIKKYREQIAEQVFADNTERELNKIIQEMLPWMQKYTNISDPIECLDELIKLETKDRNQALSIMFQEESENITKFKPTRQDRVQSYRKESISNNEQQDMFDTITQYRQTITSLRTEISEYKTQIDSMQAEIIQFRQVTNSLGVEISRLINNVSSMILKPDDT